MKKKGKIAFWQKEKKKTISYKILIVRTLKALLDGATDCPNYGNRFEYNIYL